jgi:hypothetical protein
MRAPFRRLLLAFVVAGILVVSLAGIASANVVSKTITVTNGECTKDANGDPVLVGGGTCGSATYDPVYGFTGSITFNLGEGLVHISDFICENIKGGGGFVSVAGNYTLTLTESGAPVAGPTNYDIDGGANCTDGNTQTSFPVELTVPAGTGTYVVQYSLVLTGFDPANFLNDNSILNRVEEQGDSAGHANSPSVGPPQGPPIIPEAPFSVLLVLTGGLGAAWFISRRMRPSLPTAAA